MTLSYAEYDIHTAADGADCLERLVKHEPDLVLLDIGLPDMDGMELLRKIKENHTDTVVIMITAFRDVKKVVEAIKLGAYDYLVKPVDSHELRLTVKNGLENRQLKNRIRMLQQAELRRHQAMYIGESRPMREIASLVDKVAATIETPVLITGETGSGKGVLARKIHYQSPNSNGPFITVNCGAIAGELVESELFGYGRGAFTGARAGGRKGRFEQAAGGTIFLDEIGVMPPAAQAKLLSVLEDRAFYRVGGNSRIRVNARIIAATNLDLEKAVAEKWFRQDLYFRLNVITIAIPPLRERIEDILPLAQHFMELFNCKHNKRFRSFSPEARDLLLHYSWPGNVRELRNIMERISLLEQGDTILPEHLPFAISPSAEDTNQDTPGLTFPDAFSDLDYDRCIRRLIEEALLRSKGNVTQAARLLNMPTHKLRYRMKTMDIRA